MNIRFVLLFSLKYFGVHGELRKRIFGGIEAKDGEFPYMVSIKVHGSHYCGGSIIDAKNILTAAHCIYNRHPKMLSFTTGTNYHNKGGTNYYVKSYTCHQNFSIFDGQNDICILEAHKSMKFDKKVQPIGMNENYVPADVACIFSGWGYTSHTSGFAIKLQLHVFVISDMYECFIEHGPPSPLIVRQTNICTAGILGKGPCGGDSGGPLAYNNTLIGIVSWTIERCELEYPHVFSRISSYFNWVHSNKFH